MQVVFVELGRANQTHDGSSVTHRSHHRRKDHSKGNCRAFVCRMVVPMRHWFAVPMPIQPRVDCYGLVWGSTHRPQGEVRSFATTSGELIVPTCMSACLIFRQRYVRQSTLLRFDNFRAIDLSDHTWARLDDVRDFCDYRFARYRLRAPFRRCVRHPPP